jgi:glycosyltransferase involved in cell wall biosynthesis
LIALSRLKICYIAGTLGQGGAERQLFYSVQALKKSGARVRILSLTRGEFWEEPIKALGVPVTWVGERTSKGRRLCRIVSELRREPPDFVQSQHFYTNLYAMSAARFIGSREIGAIRMDLTREVKNNGPVFGPLSLRLPRVLAANSSAAIRNAVLRGVSKDRLRFLPNVVDTEKFKPGHSPASRIRILGVGRLVEEKNYNRFLSVISRVRELPEGKSIRATIVGGGPLKPSLLDFARSLDLYPGIVEFRDPIADMRDVYHDADIMMSTSDHEGTPNVIMEAMASGLPVVATTVGGVPDLVNHNEGGLVCDLDIHCLVEAVSKLIKNPDLRTRLGVQARRRMEQLHSTERMPRFLQELYESVR